MMKNSVNSYGFLNKSKSYILTNTNLVVVLTYISKGAVALFPVFMHRGGYWCDYGTEFWEAK